MKRSIFALLLTAVLAHSACVDTQPVAGRDPNCILSGTEKFAVYVDGILMGFFEEYEPPTTPKDGTATFRKGIFPPGSFVKDWRNFNAAGPFVTERHDILVAPLTKTSSGKLKPELPTSKLVRTKLLDVTGTPAKDDPGCLVVDSLSLSVRESVGVTGDEIYTP